jgi:hypothetical protein
LAWVVGAGLADAQGRHHQRGAIVNGRKAAAGEALVRYRPLAARVADADVDTDEPVGARGWRLLRSRGRSAADFVNGLRARGDVAAVEPNYEITAAGVPDDLVPLLWGLRNTGQVLANGDHGTPGADLNAVAAWDATTGSRSVVVATIDSGILTAHPDLTANLWSAPQSFSVTIGGIAVTCPAGSHGFNVIVRSCDPADDNGHGTHVAGSIGATGGNGGGIVGVNWATSLMAVKFLDAAGNGFVSDAVDAIDFVVQARQSLGVNVRVVNASWNGPDYSQALADEIQRAGDADMLVVASAGNDGADHAVRPSYPASYGLANVVAVAATDYRDQLSSFSDFGAETVHVAAPGSVIYSTFIGPDAYTTLSGTSMAAAYVSGTAALVLARCSYSTGALRDALLRSARSLPSLTGRVQGSRRIDAGAAVRSCDSAPASTGSDIVLYASDIPASQRHGGWSLTSDPTAAGGAALTTLDAGVSVTSEPLASPTDYVEAVFAAPSGGQYHVWLRLRAAANSKWNDSVWVQFSDARIGEAPAYPINSTSGLAVNLEPCSECGVSGWGWQDGAYWMAPASTVTFAASGSHTVRVQVREDGVAFDQIVLVAGTSTAAPGQRAGDATIVPRTGTSAPLSATGATPYGGARTAIPGVIALERFDEGGEGIAYHDASPGNSGGAVRQTDVDLEPAAGGGYDVGWVSPGEWLQYSIDVASAGSYSATIRVAAPSGGGVFHLEVGGVDVTGRLTVPTTGGWQEWTTITAAVTLGAGPQALRVIFDQASSGVVGNFAAITFAPAGSQAASRNTLPGSIAAADFDQGADGTAFHDTTVGNTGGAYRQTNVDIEACSEGGFDVGWIDAGEWLNYTTLVGTAGSYEVQLRVASPSGGALHVGFNGPSNVWKSVQVPVTGGWQKWTTVTVPVSLGAGMQQLTLLFDTGGFNLHQIDVVAR